MGLFTRSADKGQKPEKLTGLQKAVVKLAQQYARFPPAERSVALRLIRSVWSILDTADAPHLGQALVPFLLKIGPRLLAMSKSLGPELIIALQTHGGPIGVDLARTLGADVWTAKVDESRAKLIELKAA